MKMNKIVISFVAAAVMLAAAGCGSSTGAASSEEAAAMASTEGYMTESGSGSTASEGLTAPPQTIPGDYNPVQDYEGAYSDESGKPYSLFLEATDEEDDVKVMIGHWDDKGAYYSYTFYGQISDNVITYKDGACDESTPEAPEEQKSVYKDGTGTLTISQDGRITWEDDKENAGGGITFVWDQELNDSLQERVQSEQN